MPATNSTAVIDPRAQIAGDAEIGPYCVIGPDVVIAAGCRLMAHVHVTGHTTIGARTRIAPFTSLGTPPQSVRYRGGPTRLVIGADCDLRESVTMNTGTEDGGGVTIVGDRCLLMVGAHIGHDCMVGNNVTMANNALLGGHVVVGDNAVLGGHSVVHQFVRIGEGAMMAGFSGLGENLIPFGISIGQRSVLRGLNVVGLRRRGVIREQIRLLRRLYNQLFLAEGRFEDRFSSARKEFAGDPLADKILAFIAERGKRPLLTKTGRAAAGEADGPES